MEYIQTRVYNNMHADTRTRTVPVSMWMQT